jgi:citrate lyase gamma subunit
MISHALAGMAAGSDVLVTIAPALQSDPVVAEALQSGTFGLVSGA